MRLLEQGPESQSTSWICLIGLSSLMNAPDLDDLVFVTLEHIVISIKAHCPIDAIYGSVGVACRNGSLQALGTDEKNWLLFLRGESIQSLGLPQHWCASFSHCHCLI